MTTRSSRTALVRWLPVSLSSALFSLCLAAFLSACGGGGPIPTSTHFPQGAQPSPSAPGQAVDSPSDAQSQPAGQQEQQSPPDGKQPPSLATIPIIYTVGDSTVETNSSSAYPRAGWGQVLGHFFDRNNVAVVNKAVGGSSSRSYYNSYWPGVRNLLKRGDYVTIGFGINDAFSDPVVHTDPYGSFQDFLTRFVTETRARGAYPIIVATQPRNAWTGAASGGMPVLSPPYRDYPLASKQLAGRLAVPLVDLDQRAIGLMQSLGQTYTTNFLFHYYLPGDWPNYPGGHADGLHFQEDGSLELARMVVAEFRRQSADSNIAKLIPFIRPTYRVTFVSNNASAGLISRSEYFPAGATVTAYARPYAGYALVSWNGDVNGTRSRLSFTMGTVGRTMVATFSGSPVVYQAEAAQLSGGTVVQTAASGYRGSGYVDFPANGGGLTFNNLNGGLGGNRTLHVRYALAGNSARSGVLVVNGALSPIRFNPGGSAGNWITVEVAVTLNAGAGNVVALRSTGADLANIDELGVR